MLPAQSPELIMDQVKTLEDIHKTDYKAIDETIRKGFTALELESVHRVYATGDGDSFHAALAAEMAFSEFARIPYLPLSAMRFLEYGADYMPVNFPRDTIVVGISASGGTTRVAQALERARKVSDQVMIAGLVGKVDTPVAKAADKVLSAQVQELGRSPGVRTYTASLMGLIFLAIRIGEIKRHFHMEEANKFRKEIVDMAGMVHETYLASIEPAEEAAALCKSAPFISYVGSGPSFGSASFSSAKIVEACGVFSVAQDLEEWAHVERFAYPLDFPVVIVAPPGKGYWRALELAKGVTTLGHPLIAVVDENDKDIKPMAKVVLPVKGQVREAFSPLLYYIPGTILAYSLAKTLGRGMFMTDNEHVMKVREEMRRQIQG